MKLGELINYLNDFREKAGDEAVVAIDMIVDDKLSTRSELANIKVYADTDSEDNWIKPIISLETKINVLGTVDTTMLVNNRVKSLIDAAATAEADEKVSDEA